MFDRDQLRSLPDQLQPFWGLADPLTVRRAVLTQMRYVADVASSFHSKAHSTSGGLFRLVWRQCRGRALTLRLRTVFLFVPQPVAACLNCYLAAKWQLDVAHTPSETFARWYMTRLTCGSLLLEGQDQSPGAFAGMHCFIGRGVWPAPLSPHLLALNHLPCPLPPYAKASPRQQA